MKKLIVSLLILLPVLLAAETYKVTLHRQARVGSTMLAPGDYKITVDGNKAEFQKGKEKFTADVKQEKLAAPAPTGYIRFETGAEDRIAEITFRGSNTMLRFP